MGAQVPPPVQKGSLVELDGLLTVVVSLAGEDGVPDDHVALWFGEPQVERMSRGGSGGARPEVWIVPEDLIGPSAEPVVKH